MIHPRLNGGRSRLAPPSRTMSEEKGWWEAGSDPEVDTSSEDESALIFPRDSFSPGEEAVPPTFQSVVGFVIVIMFGFVIMSFFASLQ